MTATPTADCLTDLVRLLAETPEDVCTRRKSLFDRLVATTAAGDIDGSVVLMGAGGFGRRVRAVLDRENIQVRGFCDNNSRIWGSAISGVSVFSPAEAVKEFGRSSVFVLSIMNGAQDPACALEQLHGLGCKVALTPVPVAWKYAADLLPTYFLDRPEIISAAKEQVLNAFHLWQDEASRREYLSQLTWRLAGNTVLPPPPTDQVQYFPSELFALRPDEVVIDCGAYDGDTIKLLLEHSSGRFAYVFAFEPDPQNYQRLQGFIAAQPADVRTKLSAFPLATGAAQGTARFAANGLSSAGFAIDGGIEVQVDALDRIIERPPTYIKMDIEGAEPDALLGAASLIQRYRPILAVCVYHTQQHLWEIPLQISRLAEGYHLFLRRYNHWCFETVCYAVPSERLISSTRSPLGSGAC